MTERSTIYVIDDDEDIRLALKGLFRSVGLDARLFSSAAEFMGAARDQGPGCLILDVRMPGIGGLEFQAQHARSDEQLPIILMTAHGDIPMTVQAMRAGAIDFLPKPFRDQDMLDAVAKALDADRRRRSKRFEHDEILRCFSALTPRERQVMALVTAGRMNKQIADDLKISEVTVKIHRGVVMKKMEVRSLADLVRAGEVLKTDLARQSGATGLKV